MKTDQNGLYSMRVVAKLTGLTPDTIRKWEQRYGAIEPYRTEGNTRKFSSEHVQRLTLLRQVTSSGHTIKDVANLPDEALKKLIQEAGDGLPVKASTKTSGEELYADLRKTYLDHIKAYRVHQAGDLLSRSALVLKPSDFVYQLVIPILRQTGELWEHGKASVAQEHLVSAQLRGLLINMRHWTAPLPGAPKVVITTPEHHLHEFGALVGAILAGSRGFDPLYLGPNLPADDILEAVGQAKAKLLLLSVVRDVDHNELADLAADLKRVSKQVETWIGLPEDHGLAGIDTGARIFHRFEELDMALTQRTTFGTN